MKRNIYVYLVQAVCIAVFTGLSVNFFLIGQGYAGALLCAAAVLTLLSMIAFAIQETLNLTCDALFRAKKFEEERALIERKMKSPIYFVMRITAMMHYVCVTMALDDLETSERYIARLRHNGGRGWLYKTAYCNCLIKLDRGEVAAAKKEFEEFRRDCAQTVIYREQIEVLTAIFSRLLTARNTAPLPEAAVNSSYPVINRILGRHYEEEIAKRADWN